MSEADTLTVVKDILNAVFGYDKYAELMSEHAIRGTYIHCNLVERKLCFQPESWQWSSVHWWTKKADALPCEFPPGNELAWKNWIGFK